MSKAVVFNAYGGPEVLQTIDVEAPMPGPGEVRIRVKAAGVQPFDALFRGGAARQLLPAHFPQRLGNEFAGMVDAVGEGVETLSVGNEVLGWVTQAAYGEHVVVPSGDLVCKPASMPWIEAGALSASGQTASTALDVLDVGTGETVLIHGAAGGVGTFAVQLARVRGAHVIGTADVRNHELLRSLGATPVAYGEALIERVRAAAPGGVDAALDLSGSTDALQASVALARNRARIVTTAFQPKAVELGIQRITTNRSTDRLHALVDLYAGGTLRVVIRRVYPLSRAAEAHRDMESGHGHGKMVLQVAPLTDGEIGYLRSQRLGRLATAQPDGTLQNSPVGVHYNTRMDTIDIGGQAMAASRKFRNVKANGRVALVVDDVVSVKPWRVRCLEIRGFAEALEDPVDSATGFNGAIIRVHPRRVISWGVAPEHLSLGARDVN